MAVKSSTLARRLPYPLTVTGVALLVALSGCNEPANGSSAGERAPAELRLGYFANLAHAQAVLGVSSGEFQQALGPTRLTTRIFNAGPSLIEAMLAGEIDIGYIGPGPVLNAHAKTRGSGIRVIAGAAANGVVIVARADAGIAALDALKGRRIATPQLGNTQDLSARHYLTRVLGQSDTENILPITNAEQLGLMQRGQIDAAWAPEPWGARLIHEAGGKLLAEEKDLWPQGRFALALVITTPGFLAKHPETVKKVLRVHRAWTRRLRTDLDNVRPQLGAELNALTGKKLPPAVFADAMNRTEFLDEPLEDTLRTLAQWAFDLDFTKAWPDLTGLVDTTILRSLRGMQNEE
jgi:NitT/TauT family transport system substrate-binding protein